jgi:TolA-binding protein
MKATERHQLKQNEFLVTTARVVDAFERNRSRALTMLGVAVLVLVVAGGYLYWRRQQADRAGALLGAAMATAQSTIAPASTLPGVATPSGTFPTEQARSEATIKAYTDLIAAYPSSDAAQAARYHLGSELLAAGRLDEAEQQFRQAADNGGSAYGPLAQLGVAQAQAAAGRYDDAIATLSALAASRDGALPVDGVLIELARTNLLAGKREDARAAYRRVVDEFPDSLYAGDARQQLTALE